METIYNDKTDLLYIRFDDRKQDVINRRVSEDIAIDIRENDRIVGIEIMDASRHIHLEKLFPVKYEVQKEKPLQRRWALMAHISIPNYRSLTLLPHLNIS
jgi:uncharacterized protein YuzE